MTAAVHVGNRRASAMMLSHMGAGVGSMIDRENASPLPSYAAPLTPPTATTGSTGAPKSVEGGARVSFSGTAASGTGPRGGDRHRSGRELYAGSSRLSGSGVGPNGQAGSEERGGWAGKGEVGGSKDMPIVTEDELEAMELAVIGEGVCVGVPKQARMGYSGLMWLWFWFHQHWVGPGTIGRPVVLLCQACVPSCVAAHHHTHTRTLHVALWCGFMLNLFCGRPAIRRDPRDLTRLI